MCRQLDDSWHPPKNNSFNYIIRHEYDCFYTDMHPEIRYLYKRIGGPWSGYNNTKTGYRLDKTKIGSQKREAGIPHLDGEP